uniref:Uncharacterized protein n=1 Tax=Schizaphis graminum TaxID=13262 RepID=A0A2S2NEG3_SCHGA
MCDGRRRVGGRDIRFRFRRKITLPRPRRGIVCRERRPRVYFCFQSSETRRFYPIGSSRHENVAWQHYKRLLRRPYGQKRCSGAFANVFSARFIFFSVVIPFCVFLFRFLCVWAHTLRR